MQGGQCGTAWHKSVTSEPANGMKTRSCVLRYAHLCTRDPSKSAFPCPSQDGHRVFVLFAGKSVSILCKPVNILWHRTFIICPCNTSHVIPSQPKPKPVRRASASDDRSMIYILWINNNILSSWHYHAQRRSSLKQP